MKRFSVSKKNKSSKKAKVFLMASLVLVSFIIFFIFVYAAIEDINDSSIAAYINGEPVFVKEYVQTLQQERAEIYAYFKQKYGVDDNPDFWDTSYGGEVPLEKAKRNALDDIIKIKVQQILAKEKGIVQDISYEKFLKDFNSENERRKEAAKNNQIIYGPRQYDERTYFDLTLGNMVEDLKKKLKSEMNFSESEYKNTVDKMVENAKVKINEKVFGKIGEKYLR